MNLKLKIYHLLRRILPTQRLGLTRILQAMIREYQRLGNLLKYRDYHFFREVNIEISQHCNRRCNYCPQSVAVLPKAFMTEEIFETVLQRLAEIDWRGPIGYAHYNEPLLDRRIVRFVRRSKEVLPNCMPHLFTNGDLLTPELTAELIDAGVAVFAITRHDLGVEKWNQKIVPLMEKYPSYFTSDVLHGSPVSNRGGLIVDPTVRIQKMNRCDDPEASLHISYEGDAMLCGCDYFHSHTFGNVMDGPILKIWRNKEFKRVRDEVRRGEPRLNICKGCFRSPDYDREEELRKAPRK